MDALAVDIVTFFIGECCDAQWVFYNRFVVHFVGKECFKWIET